MNQEQVQKLIVDKWNENPNYPFSLIAKDLKKSQKTVIFVLNWYFGSLSTVQKSSEEQSLQNNTY
jgi:hypothetical protein